MTLRTNDQPVAAVTSGTDNSRDVGSNPLDCFDDEPTAEMSATTDSGATSTSTGGRVGSEARPNPAPSATRLAVPSMSSDPQQQDQYFAAAPVGKRYFQVRSVVARPVHFALVESQNGILQIQKKLLQTDTEKWNRIFLICALPIFLAMFSPVLIGSAREMIAPSSGGSNFIFILVFVVMAIAYVGLLNIVRKSILAFFITQHVTIDLSEQLIKVVNKPFRLGSKPITVRASDIKELRCERVGRQMDKFNVVARVGDNQEDGYSTIVVGGLVGLEEALYIEQELEQFLGLVPTYEGYDREPAVPDNWGDVALEEYNNAAGAPGRAQTRANPSRQDTPQGDYIRVELKPRHTFSSPLSYLKTCCTVDCPKSIQVVNRSEGVLTIERKWRTYGLRKYCTSTAPLVFILALAFLIGMLLEDNDVESRSERVIVGSIIALLSLLAALYVILPLLRQLLNKTTISIQGDRLETKVSPIGPLWKWDYLQNSTGHVLHSVSLGTVKEIRCKGRQSSYEVHALNDNEIENVIVENLPTINEALYVEKVVSNYVGGRGFEQPYDGGETGLAEIV